MKKGLFLICLLGFFAGGTLFAERSETTKALLGNDPRTSATTGIGQVVKPVGQPVIQSPTSIYNQTVNPPAAILPPGKQNTYKGIEGIEDKVEGKEGKEIEEGLPGEMTVEEAEGEMEQATYLTPYPEQLQTTTAVDSKGALKKAKVIKIPEQTLPPVQTIPCQ